MSGYGRGLDYLAKERDRHAFKGSGIKKLWLTRDGDIAKFRILTDGNDIFTHLFHEVAMSSQRGKNFTKDVLCTRQLDDEAEFVDGVEACQYCSAGSFPKPKGVLLVYVEVIAHRYLPKDQEGKWAKVTRGSQVFYVEKVGELRLWLIRNRIVDMVADKFGELGTLVDRPWELKRMGETGEGPVQYILEGKEQGPPSEECTTVIRELTPLSEIVLEEYGGEPKKGDAVAASADVAGAVTSDTVPPDDEIGF